MSPSDHTKPLVPRDEAPVAEIPQVVRKRGRPRKEDKGEGEAVIISEGPKPKRGRPRKVPAEAVKEEPASSSYNPAAEPVSRWQYEEGYWEMRNRFLEQSKR